MVRRFLLEDREPEDIVARRHQDPALRRHLAGAFRHEELMHRDKASRGIF